MATNVESTVPAEAESNVINLLTLLRTRVDKEFNSIQTHLNERRTVLLAQINALEQKYTQSTEAAKNREILERTKIDLLKVSAYLCDERYKSTFEKMELDLRKLSAQIVEFSNIALQIDSRELMESIDKLGHLSYECKVNYINLINYEKRKLPYKTTQTNIQGPYYRDDFDMTCDDNDKIYITNREANMIHVYSTDGVCMKSLPAELPLAVCIRNNTLYVSEMKSYTICKMNIDGSSVKRIGAAGTKLGQFKYPFGLTTNADSLFVCDHNNHRLQVLTHELQPVKIIKTGEMENPRQININNDALYVLINCKSILVISVEGQLLKHLTSIKDYIPFACYFCIDTASNILFSDGNRSCIQVFSISGQHLHTLGRGMYTSTKQPYSYNTRGICVLSTGVIVTTDNINNQCCIQHF